MERDEKKLGLYFCNPPADVSLDDVDLSRVPSHISIIMDGNGRWATARGLDRSQGHVAGIKSLRETITACVRLGVDVLSAYAFSTEILGDIDALPEKTLATFMRGLEETRDNTGMTLALAVNYGSRAEIARAARLIAGDVAAGCLKPEDVNQDVVASKLYGADLPDPELLIRTSGELRLSNYLLWQLAYTEFYVTPVMWPDFGRWELLRAIRSFQGRDRRFGGVHGSGA